MSRTLIISDLHLGSASRNAVLERPAPRERLLEELERTDRLVLLGDIVELMEGRAGAAMATAGPILRAFGTRLAPSAEVVLVPGNHDRPMIRGWLRGQGARLPLEGLVPPDASPALSAVTEWLGRSRVEVRYPGVRLEDSVWATHGHYLDRHLIPVSNWGRLREAGQDPTRATPWQYERPGRVHLSPLMRWLPEAAATRVRGAGAVLRATTMPALQETVFDPRIAPLTARLLSHQMRRHALPALARVIHRLGVEADWVVFGHVHRLGPLPSDSADQWRDPRGPARFANSGAWLYEPRLLTRSRPPHPYWPGGAVILEDGSPPRAIGLLDDLPTEEMLGGVGTDPMTLRPSNVWCDAEALDLHPGPDCDIRPHRNGDRRYQAGVMFKSIVIATDGSATAQQAVSDAVGLATSVGAKLLVVSVYEAVSDVRLREERKDIPEDAEWVFNRRDDVLAMLEEVSAQARAAGVSEVDTFARQGDPADAIIDVAEEQKADVIIVGNRGMTGSRRFLLGSVPNKISHNAPCSVLIVKTT